MKSRLYIVGIKHCGKSTVGKLLANELSIPYFDLDDIIEKNVGQSVRSFYLENGKEKFQKEETIALKGLNGTPHINFICATGGGICDNHKSLEELKLYGNIIYINTPFETVYERIIKNGIPPFLKTNDPKNEFRSMYNRRSQIYKNIANIEVLGDGKSPNSIKLEILDQLKEASIARK